MTSLVDFALLDVPAHWAAPRICEQCEHTYVPKYRARRGTQQRFCSKSCKTAWQNHAQPSASALRRPPGWNRARALAKSRARRLRHAETWDGITDEEILERDGWRCQVPECKCKRRLIRRDLKYPHPWSKSVDHIIPLSLGGDDTAENKRAAHLRCNMARGNQVREEQVALFGSLREPPLVTRTANGATTRALKPFKLCGVCGERLIKGRCELHQPVHSLTCDTCGERFMAQHSRRKYCSETCWPSMSAEGKDRKRKRDREYQWHARQAVRSPTDPLRSPADPLWWTAVQPHRARDSRRTARDAPQRSLHTCPACGQRTARFRWCDACLCVSVNAKGRRCGNTAGAGGKCDYHAEIKAARAANTDGHQEGSR